MKKGLTLKKWFVLAGENYLIDAKQGSWLFDENEHQMKEILK